MTDAALLSELIDAYEAIVLMRVPRPTTADERELIRRVSERAKQRLKMLRISLEVAP